MREDDSVSWRQRASVALLFQSMLLGIRATLLAAFVTAFTCCSWVTGNRGRCKCPWPSTPCSWHAVGARGACYVTENKRLALNNN
jgi:hypothetical protein